MALVAIVALGNAAIASLAYSSRRRLLVSGLTFDEIHRRHVLAYLAFNIAAIALALIIVLGRWLDGAARHHWDLPPPRAVPRSASLASWAAALLWGASVGLGDAALRHHRRGAGSWQVAAVLALSALVAALMLGWAARRWADPRAGH